MRPRHKTSVPQVTKAWPVTLELLKAEGTKAKTGLVLVNEAGGPLLHEKLREDGVRSSVDAIKLAFDRLKRTKAIGMKDDKRGFKVFRKSGADEIAKRFPGYVVDLFLAHAAANPVRKHYASSADTESLFTALEHLRELYSLKLS